jgi:hypothetical protein
VWRKNALIVTTIVFAAAQFARSYITLTSSHLDLALYAAGKERMPFQGRMLMMYPLRWAEHNQFLVRMTNWRAGALRSPSMLVLTLTAFVCVALTCWLVTRFYLKVSQRRGLVWMPAALLLVICAVQYILHVQGGMYPYDMVSLLLFNVSMYLIYTERSWWMVLLFPVITLNREISLFLILLLALDRYAVEDWRGWLRVRFLAQCAVMSAVWLAIHIYVQHRFAGNPLERGGHMHKNLIDVINPQFWPQLACIGAFLIPFLFLYRRRIVSERVRMYLWVILPWAVCMFFYGEWIETRVFGELSGLIALAAVLELEESAPFAAADKAALPS